MRVLPALRAVVTPLRAFAAAMGALALLPVAVLWHFIATTGSEALSNDYVLWVPLVEHVLDGTMQWSSYFHDTFMSGSHCYAIPVLVTALLARFFDLSVNATLAFSVILAALKVAMLQDMIAGKSTHWLRHALWPALSALVFATANVNIFTFGFTATHVGLTEFGFVLGAWALVRFPGGWSGLLGMAAGGLLASWSWGSGPGAWPIFALALWVLPGARRRAFAVWASAAVLGCLPYVLYLHLGEEGVPLSPAEVVNRLITGVESIGWPFSGDFDLVRATWAGGVGCGLLVVGLGQLARSRWRQGAEVLPSLMLLAYGLTIVAEVALMRGHLAAWYTGSLTFVWIGLLGLGFSTWTRADRRGAEALWCGGLAAAMVLLSVTNGGYHGKVFYLRTRGPASASCLRNYRVAPLSCEQQLFQWRQGQPELFTNLARTLEHHGWGVFAPHQQWSLQGDAMLESVRVEAGPTGVQPLWAPARSAVSTPSSDYRHLNLFLPSGARVGWSMNVPRGLKSAEFTSRLATSEGAGAPRTVSVLIQNGAAVRQVFEWTATGRHPRWEPFSVSLTEYAGQEITLILTADSTASADGDWTVFKYPTVELEFADSGTAGLSDRTADVVPERFRPHPSGQDWVFPLADASQWRASPGMTATHRWDQGQWTVEKDPSLEYLGPLDLPLADYSHLQVSAAVSPNCTFRMMQVFYRTTGDVVFKEARSFHLPLFPGGNHLYSFPLRQLGLAAGAHLTGIRVDPLDGACGGAPTWVTVQNLRLVKRPELMALGSLK